MSTVTRQTTRWLTRILLTATFWTVSTVTQAEIGPAEKPDLKLGFIKLTDMAPLAIAWEQGFFLDEGLFVELEAQANWKVLLDRVITGELDGAHMLAGQPLGASIGYGTRADIITAFSMDLNGNGITVSNDVWDTMSQHIPDNADGRPEHPISASALRPVVEAARDRGERFRMGMVFPVSTHNYELRYWLAAGGLNPGYYAPQRGDTSGTLEADVHLSVTPPPQMPATMEAGTIQGYCVGEPWNQQAVFMGIGVPVITDYEIWPNNPEKVFGVTRQWAEDYRSGLQCLLPVSRHLPLSVRCHLVPHPDAPLGPDTRGQARRLVYGNRSPGLPGGHLRAGGPFTHCRRHLGGIGLPGFRDRKLPAPAPGRAD